jgi:excisionase family DNA binding protein
VRDLSEVDAGGLGYPADWRTLLTLSAEEAAALIGVSRDHLLWLARQGRIASLKPGRAVRFTPTAVELFVAAAQARRHPPAPAPRVKRGRGHNPEATPPRRKMAS